MLLRKDCFNKFIHWLSLVQTRTLTQNSQAILMCTTTLRTPRTVPA